MAGTGEQVEDVGDARTALSSLLGVSESVRFFVLWYLIRNATLPGVACNPKTATMEPKMQQRQQKYTMTWTHFFSQADEDPFDKATSQLDTVFGKLDVFNVYFHYPSRPEYQV